MISQPDKSTRRLAALYAAERILATSPTLEDAAPKLLAALGEAAGWQLGILWLVDPQAHVLRFTGAWQAADRAFPAFVARSRAAIFPPGHGELGRAWVDATPAWHADVATEPGYTRAEPAAREGLHGALIVPIWSADRVIGAVEFFGAHARRPTEAELAVVTSIARELGLFIEAKAAHEDVRRRGAILRAQMEASIDGILVIDEHQAVVGANARFTELWEVPPGALAARDDALLQAHMAALVADPVAYRAGLARFQGSPLAVGHDTLVLRDGRLLDRYTAPAIDPDGAYYGRVWYFRDVTLARRAEASLARLAAIVESSADAIFTETLDGVITTWNPGAERMYGYLDGEVIGRSVDLLVPPDRRAEVRQALAEVGRGEHVELSPTVRLRKDGSAMDASVILSPVRDASGEVVAAAVIVRDIGEILRMKRELQAQYEQLVELDRSKNAFVNAVTHELRTPLTAMRGYLEFLEEGLGGPMTPKELEFVAEIRKGEERLERLVADLLDFARIEAGTFRLDLERAPLGPKIEEVATSLAPLARKGGLRLEVDLPPEAIEVEMDPQRIGQVLINLVGNAMKFTPPGGLVAIRLTRVGEAARVEVADTGPGIAPGDLPKLFRRFVQVGAGGTHGGAGLGLSICKALIDAHGGGIGATSELGRGSTFWFELPLRQPDGQPIINGSSP